jgi:hypothetical protein
MCGQERSVSSSDLVIQVKEAGKMDNNLKLSPVIHSMIISSNTHTPTVLL